MSEFSAIELKVKALVRRQNALIAKLFRQYCKTNKVKPAKSGANNKGKAVIFIKTGEYNDEGAYPSVVFATLEDTELSYEDLERGDTHYVPLLDHLADGIFISKGKNLVPIEVESHVY